jgi:plastocyanin
MNKVIGVIIAVVIVAVGVGLAVRHNNNSTNKTADNTPTNQASSNTSNQSNTNTQSPQPTGANEISIINMNFSPANTSVKKGTTIKWINQDNISHTVTENDGKNGPSSPLLARGETYSFTFNEVGTFHYHCSVHPNMTAVVTVTD